MDPEGDQCGGGAGCAIAESDARLFGQTVVFQFNGLRCRLIVASEGAGEGRRGSVYERDGISSKYIVYAALVVTNERFLLDVQRLDKDGLKDATPKQYVCLAYADALFCKMQLEYSNDERHTYLVITLPDAEQFLGLAAGDLGVPAKSTVKIVITIAQAPDIAVHINRTMTSIAAQNCSMKADDPRLAGQQVVHLLNSMPCSLTMTTIGAGKRSSIYDTLDGPSKYVVYAALAVTEEKVLLDVQRLRMDLKPIEYLCIDFQNELCREIGLEFTNAEDDSQLQITIPGAERFLGPSSARELGAPDGSCVQVVIKTWKAPDIVLHIKRKLGVRSLSSRIE